MAESLNALKRVRKGKIGDLEYALGTKGIKLKGQYRNMFGSGQLGYNGDLDMNFAFPLLGGEMNLNAQKQDGNSRYYLNYMKRF